MPFWPDKIQYSRLATIIDFNMSLCNIWKTMPDS